MLMTSHEMAVLAISGSLRARSSNTALLEAAHLLAPSGVIVQLGTNIGELPHFNPDLDTLDQDALPVAIVTFRTAVARANALLVSTPEYAHGLPGAFKNALDWLVGSTDFQGKPVAIVSPTSRSTYAQAQLREVLATIGARVIDSASVVVPLSHREMSARDIVANANLSRLLSSALIELHLAVREYRLESPPSERTT